MLSSALIERDAVPVGILISATVISQSPRCYCATRLRRYPHVYYCMEYCIQLLSLVDKPDYCPHSIHRTIEVQQTCSQHWMLLGHSCLGFHLPRKVGQAKPLWCHPCNNLRISAD